MSLNIFTEKSGGETNQKGPVVISKILEKMGWADSRSLGRNKRRRINSYQFLGWYIAKSLNDIDNLSLYIKLAREYDRDLLEYALFSVRDHPSVKSSRNLFLGFLKNNLALNLRKPPSSKQNRKEMCSIDLFKKIRNSKKKVQKVIKTF